MIHSLVEILFGYSVNCLLNHRKKKYFCKMKNIRFLKHKWQWVQFFSWIFF